MGRGLQRHHHAHHGRFLCSFLPALQCVASAELPLFIEMQAFEISALQEAGSEAGLAAQLGGILANAVEADVERQVTSAVEGKKQVNPWRPHRITCRLASLLQNASILPLLSCGACFFKRLKKLIAVPGIPAGSTGSQTAVTGQASQKHASPDSSHEGGAHSQHALGLLASRQVHTPARSCHLQALVLQSAGAAASMMLMHRGQNVVVDNTQICRIVTSNSVLSVALFRAPLYASLACL